MTSQSRRSFLIGSVLGSKWHLAGLKLDWDLLDAKAHESRPPRGSCLSSHSLTNERRRRHIMRWRLRSFPRTKIPRGLTKPGVSNFIDYGLTAFLSVASRSTEKD